MPTTLLDLLGRRTFSFLEPEATEISALFPSWGDQLPRPQEVLIEGDARPPLIGFPILVSPGLRDLEDATHAALAAEEEAQVAYGNRESFDTKAHAVAWESYLEKLGCLLENVVQSSYGDDHPSIFWLAHSTLLSSRLKSLPRRVRREHYALGRDHGDTIKYKVLSRWSERVSAFVFDLSRELGEKLGEPENCLFPDLLAVLRDNVLILSEDHLSPDLGELGCYFQGCLGSTGVELRTRLKNFLAWHRDLVDRDPTIAAGWKELLGQDPANAGARLPHRSGYMDFLAAHPTWRSEFLLEPFHIRLWEKLLVKLKQFELLHQLRRLVLRLESDARGLVCRDIESRETWAGGPPFVRVASTTRPIDFGSSWVVDPVVRRFGLVYDISEFSATLSQIGRAERSRMDEAFQGTFQLQRRINRVADRMRLRLEKYLGDGAFYSGLDARAMLVVAISMQRFYSMDLKMGYAFDKGLRIALNHGEYRLLPLDGATEERSGRYEYFGHGLIELSRLTTGKKTQELEEFTTYLVGQGYPEATVNKFFAPLIRSSSDLVSRDEESRRFFAYINPNDTLINEGIVATERFLARLGTFDHLWYRKVQGRGYVVFDVLDDQGDTLRVGLRKLGFARFKGLDPMPVHEIIDAADWKEAEMKVIPSQPLLQATEKVFASLRLARSKSKKAE